MWSHTTKPQIKSNISELFGTLWRSPVNWQVLRPVLVSWPTWRSSKWSHQSRIILSVLSSTFFYYYLRHFVGNYNWSQKSGAERPSNWRGATLQAIHHLPAACLSYSFLCLSPSLSTTLSVSVPTKKKGTLPPSLPPSLQTPHLSPPHAVLSGSLV